MITFAMYKGLIIVLFLLILPAISYGGKVFMYIDESGVTHLSNVQHPSFGKIKYRKKTDTHRNRFSNNYQSIISKNATKYRVDAYLIKAIIETESSFNERAVSRKGAVGLMQLMPETAMLMGAKRPFEPSQNIEAGTKYFKYLMRRFKGDLRLALAAYNAGPAAVEKYGSVPPFGETRRYVNKVFDSYMRKKEAYGITRFGNPVYKVKLRDGSLLYSNTKSSKVRRLRF
jgi:soluble lytic murein transglycosylase